MMMDCHLCEANPRLVPHEMCEFEWTDYREQIDGEWQEREQIKRDKEGERKRK